MRPLRRPRRPPGGRLRVLLARPEAVALLCAGGLWLAFPPLEWTPLAWVALAPLLALLEREGGARTRRGGLAWLGAGWGFGLVLYAAHFHWLTRALLEIASVPAQRFVPFWLATVGTLALAPALALAACAWARARRGWSVAWTAPLAFMAMDAVLNVAPFGGVPWGSWAATQPHTLAAAVLAPLLGGPGVVAALVAVNAAWGRVLGAGWPPRGAWRRALGFSGCAAVTALLAWPAPLPGPAAEAGPWMLLIPGDVGVPRAGAPDAARAALRSYMARTLAALGPGSPASGAARRPEPLLVVWPESAAQEDVARGKTLVELHQVAGLAGADLMLGSDTRERGRDYNALFLVQGDVFDFQRYHKRALVPFGEYVPAGFRFLFGAKVTAGEQDYARGEEPPVLPWRGTRLGLAICFESALPRHVSAAVAGGAQAIVAIANDAWLTPAAQTHHLRLSALRGLEAGRDMVFVSNGGWTALLRAGRVARLASAQGPPLLVRPTLATHVTPWARWGVFLPLAAAAAALGIATLVRVYWRRR